MRLTRACLVLSLVVVVAGCGGSSKSSSSAPATTAAPAGTSAPTTTAAAVAGAPGTVTIKDFTFKPSPLTAKAGATVTIKNTDSVDHTVTSDDKKSFDTKHVAGGGSATFTAPAAAGTYSYHCNIHQFMTGKLIVTP
jgi:plastocyanin